MFKINLLEIKSKTHIYYAFSSFTTVDILFSDFHAKEQFMLPKKRVTKVSFGDVAKITEQEGKR